ncbi:flagellar motor protein MotS [Salibacterium halotolerans]|uniref:Chemotaxis protein MotB n=1 Tax=Salibacterium halotolerans TaxID=1884432 RepID=A0A1I5VJM7_9BACI|nr:flagellar motor protein MotS [Salibacterium halotolerans]SFQ07754.1 chemotaxis protein MotB [Salibacterium halotolerans]
MKRRKKEPEKGSPRWMTTFSDMILLVLVFFVMLFSMSVIDAKKFEAISESFQSRAILENLPSMMEREQPNQSNADTEDENEASAAESEEQTEDDRELDRLLREVRQYLEEHNLNDQISATRDDRGVVLVLQEQLLFETGEAEILTAAEPFLNKVGTLLQSLPNLVKVEGHTDERPISTFRYPSNWELSSARASSVIRYLTDNHPLPRDQFLAVGYGDTRPIAPNDSEENLRENRRVVVVISDPEFEEDLEQSAGGA